MSVWWKFLGGSVWAGGCVVLASACSGPGHDFSAATAGSASSGGAAGAMASGGSSGSGAESSGGMDAVVGGAGGAPHDESCTAGDMQTCYESSDGDSFGGKPPSDQMTCRLGARKCLEDGTWEACVGAVAPLEADSCEPGNDSNCNGVPNEGCTCTNGDKRACGSAVGNCNQGEQVCANSMWGECVGEIKPAATDSCEEGDDANCNDKPNEGCSCLNGKTKDCGTDVGPCEFGKLTCLNGVWPGPEQCVGGIKPAAADTCEPGNDANCNQALNENCKCTGSASVDCGLNVGACKYGKQTCTGGVLSACTGGVNPTTNDTCFADNAANDTNCNGHGRDGCSECVGGETANCNECGTKACDGATGKFKACVGIDTTPPRCNPSDPTKRQVCGSSGVYVAGDCTATQQCTGQGVCKAKDGETCAAAADCATGVCNQFYVDADGDTYRASNTLVPSCGTTKSGHVLKSLANAALDCASGGDSNEFVHPGATEICDGVDNDCDAKIDRDDDPNLPLGNGSAATVLAAGREPQIASSSSIYGVIYESPDYANTYFAGVDQANALKFKDKVVAARDATGRAIAWNGSTFGIFTSNGNAAVNYFNGNTAGGVSAGSPASFGAYPSYGNFDDMAAVAMGNKGWYITGTSENYSYQSYGYALTSATAPPESGGQGTSAKEVRVAVSGSTYGMVYREYVNSNFAIQFSPRDVNGAKVSNTGVLNPTSLSTGSSFSPVIAAKPGGGFGVAWLFSNGGTNLLYFVEVGLDGKTTCTAINKASTGYPKSIVATKRGFLIAMVTSGGGLELHETLTGCKFGTTYTGIDDSSASSPSIASTGAGYMLTWSRADSVYTKPLGPDICN